MSKLFKLIIMTCALIIGVLDFIQVSAQAEYLYAYLYSTDGDKTPILALIDPLKPDITAQQELPLLTEKGFGLYSAIPDPSGRWLILPFTSYQSGIRLYLYDVLNKETVEIGEGSFAFRDIQGQVDQHIVWSPNGLFFAFSIIQGTLPTSLESGVYIYDVSNKSLTSLITGLQQFSRIAWSTNSDILAVSLQQCPETSNLDCDYSLITFDASTGKQQLSIALAFPKAYASGLDALCALDWSPDNRFVSFVPFCTLEPMNPPIEVYVWDTVQGDYYPVTDFTGKIIQPADRLYLAAYYETAWIAADTLLIGAFWDDGIKLNTQTISVQLPERVSVEVAPEAIEELAVNPVTGEFAYRTVTAPPIDINKPLSVANPILNIGSINGGKLTRNSRIEIKACRLKWSPDGNILAFTVQKELGAFSYNCSGGVATNLSFMEAATGAIIEYAIPAPDDPDRIQQTIPVGWVRVQ